MHTGQGLSPPGQQRPVGGDGAEQLAALAALAGNLHLNALEPVSYTHLLRR